MVCRLIPSSLASLVKIIASYRGTLTREALLDSKAAWDTLNTYQQGYEHLSFLIFLDVSSASF